jgi:hypothetical protein
MSLYLQQIKIGDNETQISQKAVGCPLTVGENLVDSSFTFVLIQVYFQSSRTIVLHVRMQRVRLE